MGLNINNEKPTTCLNAALQKLGCAANKLQREDILAAFFNKFESFYDIFIRQGDHFLIFYFGVIPFYFLRSVGLYLISIIFFLIHK